MNATPKTPPDLPLAKLKREATISLIWAVPVLAAIVAGVLVFQNLRKIGPMVRIQFENGTGLDANQTVIRYRGVRVGSVKSVQLTRDTLHVEARVRLDRTAAGLARQGTVFWVVRPEVNATGFRALETIVSGPYIEALPGPPNGKVQKNFVGAPEAPVIGHPEDGKEFVLQVSQIRSLGPGSPVYYRGLQAGKVEYLELSPDATTVSVHVRIKPNFLPLVRENSVWWNAGGIDVTWRLLTHITMSAENLRSVVTGGIAFATPTEPGAPVPEHTVFALHDRPEDQWLGWSPHINITNALVSVPGPTPTDFNGMSGNGNSQMQK
ncbi:MAG TPA: MlaD family protein [Verrucomicrobiae bacterium]